MNIAEMFINLGVKGTDKSIQSIMGVNKGLKDTASASLEAKAALVGAMYALERMFAASGKVGTDLTNFTALIGTSGQVVQQYQYAARQVGVSNEAVTGSFATLQQQMAKTLLGEGAPKGLARVGQVLGEDISRSVEEFSRHPEKLFQKLQEYSNREKSLIMRNETLRSFGLGNDIIGSMARNAYRPEVLAKAPTYGDGEIKSLDKANIAWSNLGTKIEMAFGHFNAKHGGEIVGNISKIVDEVLKLSDELVKFADKTKIFDHIGDSVKGWTLIFKAVRENIGEIDKVFTGWKYIFEGIDSVLEKIAETTANVGDDGDNDVITKDSPDGIPAHLADASPGAQRAYKDGIEQHKKSEKELQEFLDSVSLYLTNAFGSEAKLVAPDEKRKPSAKLGKKKKPLSQGETPKLPSAKSIAAPPVSGATTGAAKAAGTTTLQTVNIDQTNNFSHPGVDPTKTAKSVRNGVREAYHEIAAQAGGQ